MGNLVSEIIMNTNHLNGKNVLITGGTGFVGSHVTKRLLEEGANVIVTYRSRNPKEYFFSEKLDNKVTLVSCDIKDKERVVDAISKYEIDYIFHIAAQALVTVAHNYPYETLMTNIMGTVNVLEAARICNGIKGIIAFSSDKAYGISEKLPYYENDPMSGSFPYDCSKSCTDLICRMYYKSYKVPVTVVRSGNIFGPGDLNFNRIIPGAISALLKNNTFEVRSDGKMVREFVYVKDVANACVLLANNIDRVQGEAFNLGSSNIFSILDLLKKIENILESEIKLDILNIAKNEIPEQRLDYAKIRASVGWENKFSFADAMKETFDWYKGRSWNHE